MADWGGGLSGAGSGAITGASVGGVPGAIAGGVIGGLGGLFGKRRKKKRLSAYDKKQQELYDIEHQAILGEGPLADLYNYSPEKANAVFEQTIANPAYRNFQEKLAPQITGQFRNAGLMNSSYAGDALSRTARDIQESLNAQRSQYLYGQELNAQNAKRNAIQNIQNRSTFAYDKSAPSGGFDINSILNQITPERVDQFKDWWKKEPEGSVASGTTSPAPIAGGVA